MERAPDSYITQTFLLQAVSGEPESRVIRMVMSVCACVFEQVAHLVCLGFCSTAFPLLIFIFYGCDSSVMSRLEGRRRETAST